MAKEPSKVEQMWDRLAAKMPSFNVAAWSKQSRVVQDSFIESLNHYSRTGDYTMSYLVMQQAAKGE